MDAEGTHGKEEPPSVEGASDTEEGTAKLTLKHGYGFRTIKTGQVLRTVGGTTLLSSEGCTSGE
mgnify:CR=1 FL=1